MSYHFIVFTLAIVAVTCHPPTPPPPPPSPSPSSPAQPSSPLAAPLSPQPDASPETRSPSPNAPTEINYNFREDSIEILDVFVEDAHNPAVFVAANDNAGPSWRDRLRSTSPDVFARRERNVVGPPRPHSCPPCPIRSSPVRPRPDHQQHPYHNIRLDNRPLAPSRPAPPPPPPPQPPRESPVARTMAVLQRLAPMAPQYICSACFAETAALDASGRPPSQLVLVDVMLDRPPRYDWGSYQANHIVWDFRNVLHAVHQFLNYFSIRGGRLSEIQYAPQLWEELYNMLARPLVSANERMQQIALQAGVRDYNRSPRWPNVVQHRANAWPVCAICRDRSAEYAIRSCGHVLCYVCIFMVTSCPMCRLAVTGVLRLFFD